MYRSLPLRVFLSTMCCLNSRFGFWSISGTAHRVGQQTVNSQWFKVVMDSCSQVWLYHGYQLMAVPTVGQRHLFTKAYIVTKQTWQFPKINFLFTPPPAPCLSSVFLSLQSWWAPSPSFLSIYPSLFAVWQPPPPLQCTGGLIELLLTVKSGTDAAHLLLSAGQLSPFCSGLKGPSVIDKLPTRGGESEHIRKRDLSFQFFFSLFHYSLYNYVSCYTAVTITWIQTAELWAGCLFTQLSVTSVISRSVFHGFDVSPWSSLT